MATDNGSVSRYFSSKRTKSGQSAWLLLRVPGSDVVSGRLNALVQVRIRYYRTLSRGAEGVKVLAPKNFKVIGSQDCTLKIQILGLDFD